MTLGILRSYGGEIGASLAEAFEYFPWRKFHWSVRATAPELGRSQTLRLLIPSMAPG